VAVEAPAHRERLDLVHDVHLLDVPVAAHAADPGAHVGAVVEVRVLADLVHAQPAHRLAALLAVADRRERLGVARDQQVAVHAHLGRRHVGDRDFSTETWQ
jgi:hypothetical protein